MHHCTTIFTSYSATSRMISSTRLVLLVLVLIYVSDLRQLRTFGRSGQPD